MPHDYSLVSFDVKSLFTSIPIPLAMDAVADAINSDDELLQMTTLEKEDII